MKNELILKPNVGGSATVYSFETPDGQVYGSFQTGY